MTGLVLVFAFGSPLDSGSALPTSAETSSATSASRAGVLAEPVINGAVLGFLDAAVGMLGGLRFLVGSASSILLLESTGLYPRCPAK